MQGIVKSLVVGFGLCAGAVPAQAQPFMSVPECRAKGGSPVISGRGFQTAFCIIDDSKKPSGTPCVQKYPPSEYVLEDYERDSKVWYFCAIAEMNKDDVYADMRARQGKKAAPAPAAEEPKAVTPAPAPVPAPQPKAPARPAQKSDGLMNPESVAKITPDAFKPREQRLDVPRPANLPPPRMLNPNKPPMIVMKAQKQPVWEGCVELMSSKKVSANCDFVEGVPMYANDVRVPAQYAHECPSPVEYSYIEPSTGKEGTGMATTRRSIVHTCGGPMTSFGIR